MLAACTRLGILSRADREAAAEPDERWLDGLDEALTSLPAAQQDAIRLRIVDDSPTTRLRLASTSRPRCCARASRAASAPSASISSTRWSHLDDAPPPDLALLGDDLERAATADLAQVRPEPGRTRRHVSRRLVVAVAALAGTEPTCTIVTKDVEFRCVLAHAPAPEVADWKGTVEPTVDASKHVNGGCRSLVSDGKDWQCYLGQKAVDEQIIGPGLLGEFAPGPGVG